MKGTFLFRNNHHNTYYSFDTMGIIGQASLNNCMKNFFTKINIKD